MFAKPLLSNGYCIFAYLVVFAEQRVYMPQIKEENNAKKKISFGKHDRTQEKGWMMSELMKDHVCSSV
jgi:hypothetical protein